MVILKEETRFEKYFHLFSIKCRKLVCCDIKLKYLIRKILYCCNIFGKQITGRKSRKYFIIRKYYKIRKCYKYVVPSFA